MPKPTNLSLLRAALQTRADTKAAAIPTKPDYAAILNLRQPTKYPSRDTMRGDTNKPETQSYSGNNMIGISTMHKSNSVPVFSKDEAINIATMRRN